MTFDVLAVVLFAHLYKKHTIIVEVWSYPIVLYFTALCRLIQSHVPVHDHNLREHATCCTQAVARATLTIAYTALLFT